MTDAAQLSPLPQWPDYGLTDDLLPTLERWAADGKRAALATLVRITGSSPRPLGSDMAICEDGEVQGYVSGGCVEAAVRVEALECLKDGQPRTLDYGAGSPVLDIQLTCGGRIGIFVRPIPDLAAHVAVRKTARDNRRPITLVTDLDSGSMTFWNGVRPTEQEAGRFFRPYLPPLRLVLAGGDPVTLAILNLSAVMGLETILIRPYGPPEPPPGLPPTRYLRGNLEAALPTLPLDRWTAVYSLTHDAHSDLMLTAHALKSDAFCVSVLGSRRKISGRLKALSAAGVPPEALDRLHLPAGLEIGAQAPMEIALSILAQMIAKQPQ
ncbi:XdhC family protein [Gluconobacter sp. Dm-73]|uniref:XdhC family protein n=1 Tax=Gluconobacter sp. Dm-73 TaxID=2799802 RepID=UPI001B8D036C|nr:XdhC family protein [Gluconobacter sp. Dm-73]MBS1074311.1 XdhC family protein [Gluconobacter sp. Dm-73]